jgi:hypothetical protein
MLPKGKFICMLKRKFWGKNEDLTDFKGKTMENIFDTSALNAGVKEKNTKTNKIIIYSGTKE